MLKNLETFRKIKEKHANEIIEFLQNENEEFDILCVRNEVDFNPKLPEHISSSFGDILLFTLANYTLQSSYIQNGNLIFEAGFGEENFGSVVSVPLDAILQISKEDTPLFVNVTATIPKPKEEKPKNPFILNPRNKKFMKQ